MPGFGWKVMVSAGIFAGHLLGVCTPTYAEGVLKDPERLIYDKDGNPDWFESKPAEGLMSPKEYRSYREALDALNCDKAGRILSLAFVQNYPQFQRARITPNCEYEIDCINWENYAHVVFDELGYCVALKDFEQRQLKLLKSTSRPPKFARPYGMVDPDPFYEDRRVLSRDLALDIVVGKAWGGFGPALLKLAELVEKGGIFNAGEEVEYYLRLRACFLKDKCSNRPARIGVLKQKLDRERVAMIEAFARDRPEAQPRLDKLMLDGKTWERYRGVLGGKASKRE
ncbi:MAG: hypothetical protein K0U74_03425 [Alphaproteobacteria bacterium]|nr:hypothetical protein [Alphaproteobacteria bacterium]